MVTGMKQTEIGLIPEDWEVKKLGSIAFITKLAGFEYSKHFNSYKDGGEIIVVRGTNITNNKLDLTDTKYIPRKVSDFLYRSKLSKGDLVFAYVGTIGPIYLIGENDRFHLGPNTSKIRIEDKDVSTRFIYNYFLSEFIRKEIDDRISVGAQPSLSMTKIRDFSLPLPPLPEQEAIAGALSDADAWIESLEQLIAKKRLIKQGAMQELLTPKEEWEVKKLGEVADFFKGRGLPKSQLNEGGKLKCIHYGELFTKYKELIGTIRSRTDTIDIPFLSKTNDVLMPTSDVTPRGLATASCITENGVVLGGDILIIRFKSSIDGVFFSYFISNNKEEVLKFVSGSTVYHLYGKELSNLNFHFPKSLTEQTRIATILSDMDAELEALEQQLHKARQIKQGMMQELLTGRVRLV